MIHILTGTYAVVDPLFGRPSCPVELDMGCGKGGFALQLARRYPERLVLGSDVMLGRLRKIARKAKPAALPNLELLRANNRDLAAFQIRPSSIDRIHLLCPDPWPKSRHRNKRLVTCDFLMRLTRIIKPGGVLHLATDHGPYFEEWTRMLALLPAWQPASDAIADVADIRTDFERQWLAQGKTVPHMAFRHTRPEGQRPEPEGSKSSGAPGPDGDIPA